MHIIDQIPVTMLPLASVTDITAWVTGLPFGSVTTLPLESVIAITVSVTGFPLGSKCLFCDYLIKPWCYCLI